jgi:ABC-type transport system involved in cytochrome c biogenesis ATPase subunit
MSFTVQPGQVTGFVGPNGAGKSTTMRVILGLDAADEGTALIDGQPYRSLRHPLSRVGSLLDAAALQPSRTARNHLLWLAHSQGLGARRVDAVIGQAGLDTAARRKAGGYSLGMRQRLGIAAALLGDPPVQARDRPGTRDHRARWAARSARVHHRRPLAGRAAAGRAGTASHADPRTRHAPLDLAILLTISLAVQLAVSGESVRRHHRAWRAAPPHARGLTACPRASA